MTQDTGTSPPCCEWLRPILHPGRGQTNTTACPLRSATANWLSTSLQRGGPGRRSTKSQLFAVLAPQCWNKFPVDIRTAETLHIVHRRVKHLFRLQKAHKKATLSLSLVVSKCSSSGSYLLKLIYLNDSCTFWEFIQVVGVY